MPLRYNPSLRPALNATILHMTPQTPKFDSSRGNPAPGYTVKPIHASCRITRIVGGISGLSCVSAESRLSSLEHQPMLSCQLYRFNVNPSSTQTPQCRPQTHCCRHLAPGPLDIDIPHPQRCPDDVDIAVWVPEERVIRISPSSGSAARAWIRLPVFDKFPVVEYYYRTGTQRITIAVWLVHPSCSLTTVSSAVCTCNCAKPREP